MRAIRVIATAMIVLLAVVGCSDGGSDGESTTLDDLRQASTCPIEFDRSVLPSGLIGEDPTVNVIDDETLVEAKCDFPRTGGATPDRGPIISVKVSAVPADSNTDLFSNRVLNQTGVDVAEFQQTVEGLSVDEVAVLKGSFGTALAVRPVEIDGASSALILAYAFGVAEQTGGELEAIVSAATM